MYEYEKYNILHPICEESIKLFLNLTLINGSFQKSLLNDQISFWLGWIKKAIFTIKKYFNNVFFNSYRECYCCHLCNKNKFSGIFKYSLL